MKPHRPTWAFVGALLFLFIKLIGVMMTERTSIKSYLTYITRWLTNANVFGERVMNQNKVHNEKNDFHNKSTTSRSSNKVDDKNSSRYYSSYLRNQDISSHFWRDKIPNRQKSRLIIITPFTFKIKPHQPARALSRSRMAGRAANPVCHPYSLLSSLGTLVFFHVLIDGTV